MNRPCALALAEGGMYYNEQSRHDLEFISYPVLTRPSASNSVSLQLQRFSLHGPHDKCARSRIHRIDYGTTVSGVEYGTNIT